MWLCEWRKWELERKTEGRKGGIKREAPLRVPIVDTVYHIDERVWLVASLISLNHLMGVCVMLDR